MSASPDPKYEQFCTPRQWEVLNEVWAKGSQRAAARSLNIRQNAVSDAVRAIKRKATAQGYSPEHGLERIVPEPHIAKGHSTLDRVDKYDPETGRTTILQWTKSDLGKQAWLDQIKDGVAAFTDGVGPLKVSAAPLRRDKDIIPWINIGDGHLGMLAYEAQTGENFNLEIAQRELCGAISILIDEMPATERLVINDLGDFTHYENEEAVTEASGHRLDAAAFFALLIQTYSKVMRFVVEKALEKAKFVDVIVNQGNHSRKNDLWMAELLRVAYGHTGRVNVLNNDNVFIAYRMGNTFVMTHHSDKCKPARLAHVMATDFAADWGETEYRYIDIGHIHHGMILKEHPGVSVESFNTLAPKDNWAHQGGWRSRSSITVVYRSRTYGDLGRRVLPIREVRDRIIAAMPRKLRGQVYRPMERRAYAV